MRARTIVLGALLSSACFDPDRSSATATEGSSDDSTTGATATSVSAGPTSNSNPATDDGASVDDASNDAVTDDPTTSATTDPDSSGSETTGNPVVCTEPALLGTLPTTSQTLGTAVWGSRGYVTHTNQGLLVIDLTDPTSPAQLGMIGIPNPSTVVVAGTTAYVGDPTGVYVIDASNSASPMQAGVVMEPMLAVTGVAIEGDYIYATDNDNGDPCATCGLHVIDASTLEVVASLPISDDVREVVIAGTYAFVALGLQGLAVVDITQPSAPALVTTLPIAGFTYKLALAGDRLYTAQFDAGLGVFDVSDPTNPMELGNAPGTLVSDVAVDGDWAWVTDSTPSLRVLDVSDPANIVELATLDGFGQGAGIALGNDVALVGSYDDGVRTVAPPACE